MEVENKITQLAVGAELGNIYYQWNDDIEDFDTYRIMGIQNNDTVRCKCCIDGKPPVMKKMKLEDLRENYYLLISHAMITVSKVIVATKTNGQPVYDIVIMVYKREDAQTEFNVPDVICRQAMSDIFYEPFCNQQENPYVGLSVSKDTIPVGYSMKDLTMCDKVLESIVINTYKTDTLDTINSLINPDRWNDILEELLNLHYQNKRMSNPFLPDKVPDVDDGYCRNIKLLMETNNFMYDFYKLLGITKVNFTINYDTSRPNDEQPLPLEQKEIIQDIYQTNMEKTFVLPFDFSLDFDKIRLNYVLIMDATNILYIIGFTKSPDEYVKVIDTSVSEEIKRIHEKISNAVSFYDKYSK